MAARALNKVLLIGNLTRDPELRYTPSGTAVCTFGLATNRQWTTDGGEKKEDVEFHRIVAWQKLAEICSKFLSKGRKIFLEGRLQTRTWTTKDGQEKQTTEVVISDMIILDFRRGVEERVGGEVAVEEVVGEPAVAATPSDDQTDKQKEEEEESKKKRIPKETEKAEEVKKSASKKTPKDREEKVEPKDIPF